MSKLFFFRHAQASLGKENYDVLSKKGELQAAELGKFLINNNINFDRIYVGELRRQQHTYEIIKEIFEKKNLHLPDPIILEELNEHQATEAMKIHLPNMINSDPYINRLWKEIEKEPSKKNSNLMLGFEYFLHKWIDNEIKVKGIIPWKDFRKNVNRGLKKILKNTNKSEKTGVFTSGGTISSIVGDCLKIKDEKRIASLNFSIRNTSFSIFLYSKKHFNLLSFNELPHLKKDMITFV